MYLDKILASSATGHTLPCDEPIADTPERREGSHVVRPRVVEALTGVVGPGLTVERLLELVPRCNWEGGVALCDGTASNVVPEHFFLVR